MSSCAKARGSALKCAVVFVCDRQVDAKFRHLSLFPGELGSLSESHSRSRFCLGKKTLSTKQRIRDHRWSMTTRASIAKKCPHRKELMFAAVILGSPPRT